MTDGSFSDRAREAIYAVTDGRCAGCLHGRPLTCQHRRARGRGGTSDPGIASPANGVPLCGSGTTGCHGWAEANPYGARQLGWRLEAGDDPLEVPLYLAPYGWRRYAVEHLDGYRPVLLHEWADPPVRDEPAARVLALFLGQLTPPPLPAFLRPPKGNR